MCYGLNGTLIYFSVTILNKQYSLILFQICYTFLLSHKAGTWIDQFSLFVFMQLNLQTRTWSYWNSTKVLAQKITEDVLYYEVQSKAVPSTHHEGT